MGIKIIYSDVGGVLLSNGWDTKLRQEAVKNFQLDWKEVESRHEQIFADYETDRISLDEYLRHVVFYLPRPFEIKDFKEFIFSRSTPYPEMLNLLKEVKSHTGIKLAVLSNEGREIAAYRFKKYSFSEFVDYFIVSSYVKMRKPDPRIFKVAVDLSQEAPEEIVYIEDRLSAVEAARSIGMQAIHHESFETTRNRLLDLLGIEASSIEKH